jgi:hypothetical protein
MWFVTNEKLRGSSPSRAKCWQRIST